MSVLRNFSVVIGLWSVLTACEAPPTLSRLDLPIDGSHRAAVIAIELDDSLQLFARNVVEGRLSPITMSFARERIVRVTALLYERELSAFQLTEGELQPAQSGELSRALPRASSASVARLEAGALSSFQTVSPTDALPSIRLAARARCASLRLRPEIVQVPRDHRFALPLPGGVLFATVFTDVSQTLLHVTPSGATQLDTPVLDPAFGSTEFRTGHAAPDGQDRPALWLGEGNEGDIWKAEFDPGENGMGAINGEPHGRLTAHQEAAWASGWTQAGHDKLFLMTREFDTKGGGDSGFLERYHTNSKESDQLFFFAATPGEPQQNSGGVAYIQENEVLALWPFSANHVFHFREGERQVEFPTGPSSIGAIEGVGGLVGTKDGAVYLLRETSEMISAGHGEISAFASFGLNSVFAHRVGEGAQLVQYAAGRGICDDTVDVDLRIRSIIRSGDELVILGGQAGSSNTTVRWVTIE